MILKYNPAPRGEIQWRCLRPRPAVCSPATTHKPSAAPSAARFAASRFVDGSESKCKISGINVRKLDFELHAVQSTLQLAAVVTKQPKDCTLNFPALHLNL